MPKALEPWQVNDIRKQKAEGKTDMQLAQLYNVHYKVIQDCCKPIPGQFSLDGTGQDIKVIGITPGKTLNFAGVTEIRKGKDWIEVRRGEEVIGLLNEANITAIVPLEG